MGLKLKEILLDPSLPTPFSVRKFVCPSCFDSCVIIFYTQESMGKVECSECGACYEYSHRSKRLFNWDRSRAMSVESFSELSTETILRA